MTPPQAGQGLPLSGLPSIKAPSTDNVMNPILSFFFGDSLVHPNDSHRLTISKVAAQILLAQKIYGRTLGLDPASKEDTLADLALMLANQDLKRVEIDLLAGRRVLHQLRWDFALDAKAGTAVEDHTGATELPVLDLRAVDGSRFVVHRRGREHLYRHQLRISWSAAETLPVAEATETRDAHTAKITGGRVASTLRVAETERRRIRVTRTGAKGYAFGQDLTDPRRIVFLHPQQAASGTSFRIGQIVSAILIATPRGFQGREIQT